MNNKIAKLETALYRIPLPVTLSDSTHGDMTHFELITARVFDTDGAEGMGYTYTVGANGAAIQSQIQRDLTPLLLGPAGGPHRVRCGVGCGGACITAAAAAVPASPFRRWTSRYGT